MKSMIPCASLLIIVFFSCAAWGGPAFIEVNNFPLGRRYYDSYTKAMEDASNGRVLSAAQTFQKIASAPGSWEGRTQIQALSLLRAAECYYYLDQSDVAIEILKELLLKFNLVHGLKFYDTYGMRTVGGRTGEIPFSLRAAAENFLDTLGMRPVDFYRILLDSGDVIHKGFAILCLARLEDDSSVKKIESFIHDTTSSLWRDVSFYIPSYELDYETALMSKRFGDDTVSETIVVEKPFFLRACAIYALRYFEWERFYSENEMEEDMKMPTPRSMKRKKNKIKHRIARTKEILSSDRPKRKPLKKPILTAEEIDKLKIDINTAKIHPDLMKLPDIDENRARMIDAYRHTYGPFKSVDELNNVPDITPVIYERIKGNVYVDSNAYQRQKEMQEQKRNENKKHF